MKIIIEGEDPRRVYDALDAVVDEYIGVFADSGDVSWRVALLREVLDAIDKRYPPHVEIDYHECINCHINIGVVLDPVRQVNGSVRWLCNGCMDLFTRTRWAQKVSRDVPHPVPQPGELFPFPPADTRLPNKEHRGQYSGPGVKKE